MFRLLLLLSAWLALWPGGAQAAIVNGHGYVPVADWAEANGLQVSWIKRGEQVVVSNRILRLVLAVNSQQVEVNGIMVRLCLPVANVRGVPQISQLDADKTLRTFLYPPRTSGGRRSTTICLDAGHGGKDTGNQVNGHDEKTYTLALAQELRDQLSKLGFHVVLTRTDDTYIKLPDRPAIANRQGADLFVCLHFNATTNDKAEVSGPETYCITPVGASSSNAEGEGANYGPTTANRSEQKSLLLAYEEQKSLVKNLGANDRAVRRARYAVLRDATMPAILIEGGYMTHPVEGRRIFDFGYRRLMARAIVQGIQAYQRIVQAGTVSPTPAKHGGHSSATKHSS